MSTPSPDLLRSRADDRLGWLELFFDLVIVASIGLMSESLHEHHTLAGAGQVVVFYAAVWMTWIAVVLYADIAGPGTHVRTVLVCMLLVGVMTAAAPWFRPDHANAFAWGFLIARIIVGQAALRTGRMLAAWPLLQFSGLSTLWIVSLWVPAPHKYWLWAAALALDLALVMLRGERTAVDKVAELQQRAERAKGHRRRWRNLTPVGIDRPHLDERLGTFTIIVFGEAVIQLSSAGAHGEWDRTLAAVAGGGFLALIGLWSLTFSYGFAAAPHTRIVSVAPRFGLPAHLASTLGLLLFATGLGAIAAEPQHHLDPVIRWVLCGGLSLVLAVSLLSGIAGGATPRWIWTVSVPTVAAPPVIAAVGGHLRPGGLVWLLTAVVGWQVLNANRAALMERLGIGRDTTRAEAAEISRRYREEQRGRSRTDADADGPDRSVDG